MIACKNILLKVYDSRLAAIIGKGQTESEKSERKMNDAFRVTFPMICCLLIYVPCYECKLAECMGYMVTTSDKLCLNIFSWLRKNPLKLKTIFRRLGTNHSFEQLSPLITYNLEQSHSL